AAEACRERKDRSPSRPGGAAAALATGGADEAASRAAAAAASAGGRQGAGGCSAVEGEGTRMTPSDRGKLRRSLTAGADVLAGGGEETAGSADVGVWRAVRGAREPAAAALTSSRRLHSCASAAASPLGTGGDGAEGWMWEYQGHCEHRSWNFSSAAHSPQTHLHVPHSAARTSGCSFFSPSHHSLSSAHDLLPRSAYLHLSALEPWCAADSPAPCSVMGSAATRAATGAAVCLAAAAEWLPWDATPPSTPATPALPPIPVAPPSSAPPPSPPPRPAQLQQTFPRAAAKGAANTGGGGGERWWVWLTRPWRQRSDRWRRARSGAGGPSVLLTCCVH
ncbi:unnamed protein product, partial [Closterium sp. NIES-53]